jgi:hypothetical protein
VNRVRKLLLLVVVVVVFVAVLEQWEGPSRMAP